MLKFTDVFHPKEGEQICAVVRKHGITLWPSLLLAGILIATPFFFLFPLTKWGTWGLVVFVVLVACGLLIALRAFLLWDADVLLITNERVVDVDQRGLLSRVVCETPLLMVQEVSWERHGLWETLWRMGSLRIRNSGPNPEWVSPKVSRPERLTALLHELREQQRVTPTLPSPSEQVERISRAAADADQKTLEAVEALLKSRSGPAA